MLHILIIGGSDAGISAAVRARELNPASEVTIVTADRYPNYSICGLPFYLSGEVDDWQSLAHRTVLEIENEGIHLLLEHSVASIDPIAKVVSLSRQGNTRNLGYDGLIIATGAESIQPPVDGINLPGGVGVKGIVQSEDKLIISGSNSFSAAGDMVLVAVGARPNSKLALSAGLEIGLKGAIKVDHFMRTNVPDIFAAGDCVETWHRLLDRYTYMPLGTTAHKQGRVAGENAVGGSRQFQGSLGTQAVKIFDRVVARTGLLHSEAAAAGFDPFTVESETWDHKAYYPGARAGKELLGVQMLGSKHSEVSKRIDVFASAIYNRMRIDELNDLDLSYTPPLSSPWDPIQMSAQAWSRGLSRLIRH